MINHKILKNNYVKRGFAFYIDGSIITFFTLVILLLFDKESLSIECESVFCWNTKRIVSFQLLFYFLYFFLMEFVFFKTIGKMFFGFYIFQNKKDVFFWRVLLRTFLRLVPLNIISFSFNKKYKFWHELWTGIYTKKL